MTIFFKIIVTAALIAFATVAQADDTPRQKPMSQGPDFSDLETGTKGTGQLSDFHKRQIEQIKKSITGKRVVGQIETLLKQKKTPLDLISKATRNVIKINKKVDLIEKLYRDGLVKKKEFVKLLDKQRDLSEIRTQLAVLYSYEMAEKYQRGSKKHKRISDRYDVRSLNWWKRYHKLRAKQRMAMGLPEKPLKRYEVELAKPNLPKSEENKSPNNQEPVGENKAGTGEKHNAADDVLNQTKAIQKDPEKLQEDQIIDAGGDGMLGGKNVKLSHLNGCGTMITGFSFDEETGFASTPCPGLTGGRVASQADYLAHCNSFEDFSGPCGPPGAGTEKRSRNMGIYGMPFSVFCISLHFDILSTKDSNVYNRVARQGGLFAVYKYNNGSRKLECFYLSKEQNLALWNQYKNRGKAPTLDKPVTKAEPKNKPPDFARSTDKTTGITTKSVRNPDGSHTVTKTDKDGNVLSSEKVGKPPTSASSTDKNTGITTTSVKNPDGSRTVTKTDKDGNVLSKEKVGKSPAFASSKNRNTGETTTSVANPDGSRTLTRKDADGNVLSREKVR